MSEGDPQLIMDAIDLVSLPRPRTQRSNVMRKLRALRRSRIVVLNSEPIVPIIIICSGVVKARRALTVYINPRSISDVEYISYLFVGYFLYV